MEEFKNLPNRVALGIRETAAALGVSEGLVRDTLDMRRALEEVS